MTALTSWLLTYLLHSTLLLGGAALLCGVLKERRLGLQEAVLRAALVGGLLTATLQLGLGMQPLGGVVTLPEEAARALPVKPDAARLDGGPATRDVKIVFGSLPSVLEQVRGEDEADVASAEWWLRAPSLWRPALTSLWAALALLALARMGVAAVRLRHLLRSGLPLRNDDLAARASALAGELGLRRPVPMSTAPELEVPLATGVRRPEVYLPARALEELEEEQQVALCAHELAHVARRDPAWILAARLVEALVPIQPLNTWARRRLQDLAECLSDDLAVAACGHPLGLARSLVDVASWTVARPVYLPAAVSGALSTRSRLANRVERLMDPLRSLERPSRLVLPVAAAAVLATALVTPVVSGQPGAGPEAATLPAAESREAPEIPIAPDAPEPPAAPSVPAAPSAPAIPEAPEVPQAPEAPETPKSDATQRLEELTRTIEERVEAHHTALAEVEEEIEALVQQSMPDQEELARLGQEVEFAARALAEARRAGHEGAGRDETSRQEIEAARRQLDDARKKMGEAARSVRIPEEELRRVREKARRIAEAAKPTAEEREEIRRLAREIARESRPDRDEMRRLQRELARESLSQAREAMREAQHEIREALREALPEIREAARAARETALEAARAACEVAREAREGRQREMESERGASQESENGRTRTLEEAEEAHLEKTLEEGSRPDAPKD